MTALFIAAEPVALSRSYLATCLGQPADAAILAGVPGADRPDPGFVVCSCFNVGMNTIADAITSKGLLSVAAIGQVLPAGSHCGSCRPKLKALIARHVMPVAKAAE